MQGKTPFYSPKKSGSPPKAKTQSIPHNIDTLNQNKQQPSMYHIVLVDKKHPPISVVKQVLEEFFHMDAKKAHTTGQTLLDEGTAICGSFTREVAENKVAEVREFSKHHQQLFDCIIRKEGTYAFKKPRA